MFWPEALKCRSGLGGGRGGSVKEQALRGAALRRWRKESVDVQPHPLPSRASSGGVGLSF